MLVGVEGLEATRRAGSCSSLYFFLDSLMTVLSNGFGHSNCPKLALYFKESFHGCFWVLIPPALCCQECQTLLSGMSDTVLVSQESDAWAQYAAMDPSYLPCYLAYAKFTPLSHHILEARLSHG